MRREKTILVLGADSAHMSAMDERVRALGYRSVRAETPDQAIEIAREKNLDYGVGLFEAQGFSASSGEALESIRRRTNSRHLHYIATGDEPGAAQRAVLRAAGVDIALWTPVEDRALRFQFNASMSGKHDASSHSEARAPIDVSATVSTGGQFNQVSIYSLSAGGAFLETTRPALPGADLEVTLLSPDGELSLDAHVLYTNVPGRLSQPTLPLGMGVRFENLGRSAADAIGQIVKLNTVALTP
jgi:hypothetical protein